MRVNPWQRSSSRPSPVPLLRLAALGWTGEGARSYTSIAAYIPS
jgi:hypothetical protein